MLIKKILLKEVMVNKPFTIKIDEPFSRVWEILKMHGIRHLPVIDDKGVLKGIITQRDLYKYISPRHTMEDNFIYDKNELDKYILDHVMTKEVLTLSPEDTLGTAMDIVIKRKYGCIPITDSNKKLLGIVTHIDILKKIAEYFI
jgi:CBS domain-containing protein